MATWPSGSKASNQYTDSPTDRIADARAEINQNITNTNSIVDMFNIPASPINGYILSYDTTNDRFEMIPPLADKTVVSHDTDLTTDFVGDSAGYGSYNGGFSFVAEGFSNITLGSNATASTITFPSGTYFFDSETITWTYSSGGAGETSLDCKIFGDGILLNTILDQTIVIAPGPFTTKSFRFSGTYTFLTETTVHFEYDADGVSGFVFFELPDLQITKFA